MPIFDNHIHLQASFKGIEAAKAFENAGGTAFLLTHMPYAEIPIRVGKDYERAYRKTLAMADAVRQATSIRVFVALGPYPVDFLQLKESVGPEAAADAMREGFDLAAGHTFSLGGTTTLEPSIYVTNIFDKNYFLKGAYFSAAAYGERRNVVFKVALHI